MTMARVMTTNAAKIAMFSAGEPTEVASAKGSVRAMGQFSFEEAAAESTEAVIWADAASAIGSSSRLAQRA